MTIGEVSALTGVSVRMLRYYDELGLLKPASVSGARYRLYDDASLGRLRTVLLFRELELPLCEIKAVLDDPRYDSGAVLERQIELLTLRRQRLDGIIALAREIKEYGGDKMDFSAFDKRALEDYAARAKQLYGDTDAYAESDKRTQSLSQTDRQALSVRMMSLFADLGGLRGIDPASREAREWVERLRGFIDGNLYPCTDEILQGLGAMYRGDPEFAANIDGAGGEGTAELASRAIEAYFG